MNQESDSLYTSTGKRKFVPKIFINLGRCRYDVVRSSAESLGWAIDFDDENLAATITKTIQQPQRPSNNNSNINNKKSSQLTTSSSFSTARSNLHTLTVGNNFSNRAPLTHDAVFRMIESRRAHIMWSDVTVTTQQLSSVAVWQRLNHFPGISQTVSRKVPLGQTMMKAWKLAPQHFANIVPLSFSLKKDTPILRQYFEEVEFSKKLVSSSSMKKKKKITNNSSCSEDQASKNVEQEEQPAVAAARTVAKMSPNNPFKDTTVFIFKPNSGCMGHDIKLTCKPLQMMQRLLSRNNINATRHLKADEDFVCQEYIDRPMLIERKKFDLRVYVLLMGVSPDLRILIHEEGLVRICATEYLPPKPSNVRNSTMHLTNYAVNKKTLTKRKIAKSNSTNDDDDDNDGEDEEEDECNNDEDDDDDDDEGKKIGNGSDDDEGEEIDGIKRDFSFLNAMLDTNFASVGGSKEIWRKIDRAIVLTMMAAHSELDRIYRQATATNQVLLRRTAVQFLKEAKELKRIELEEAEEKRKKSKISGENEDNNVAQIQQHQSQKLGNDDDNDDDEDDDDFEEEEEEGENDLGKGADGQTKRKSSSITAILDQITSEEDFINNCCIGRNCFELLGFDMLLTEEGHPLVMEVNHGPSLETGADIDMRIKTKVLQDSFRHIATFLPDNTKKTHLRGRRYLQKIVRRGGTNPMLDLLKHEKLNPNTGYRLAYPNVNDEILADEYKKARAIIKNEASSNNNNNNMVSSGKIATPPLPVAASNSRMQQQQQQNTRTASKSLSSKNTSNKNVEALTSSSSSLSKKSVAVSGMSNNNNTKPNVTATPIKKSTPVSSVHSSATSTPSKKDSVGLPPKKIVPSSSNPPVGKVASGGAALARKNSFSSNGNNTASSPSNATPGKWTFF